MGWPPDLLCPDGWLVGWLDREDEVRASVVSRFHRALSGVGSGRPRLAVVLFRYRDRPLGWEPDASFGAVPPPPDAPCADVHVYNRLVACWCLEVGASHTWQPPWASDLLLDIGCGPLSSDHPVWGTGAMVTARILSTTARPGSWVYAAITSSVPNETDAYPLGGR